MNDVDCPYCGKSQEINHDDGYGYEENLVHNQECGDCGKTFGYQTTISFDHDACILPCANGEGHDLKDIYGCPSEFFVGKKRCSHCGEEVMVDQQAHMEAMKKYGEDQDERIKARAQGQHTTNGSTPFSCPSCGKYVNEYMGGICACGFTNGVHA